MQQLSPIDLVYTWVDGSSPMFVEQLEKFKRLHAAREGTPLSGVAVGPQRFRDFDNLRYSLRSAAKNAPWFNQIFIVTNGQSPRWLRKDTNIQIIQHEDIFPNLKHLPTFNASAIETHLYRIPGLSRYFVYMNDDFFFSRPIQPGYFFGKNGLPKLFFAAHVVSAISTENLQNDWYRKLARLARLMKERFGPSEYLHGAHGPTLFDKDKLEKVYSFWAEEADQTSQHRFRNENDLQLHMIYANTLLALDEQSGKPDAERHEAKILIEPELRTVSVGSIHQEWRHNLKEVIENPPTLLCLNDSAPSDLSKAEASELEKTHRTFLEKMFPEPSPYERQTAS